MNNILPRGYRGFRLTIVAHNDIDVSGYTRFQSAHEQEHSRRSVLRHHRIARQRFGVRRPSAAFTDGTSKLCQC